MRGTASSASLGALHPGQTSSGPSTAQRDSGHKVTPTVEQPELADESLSHPKCQGTASRSPMTQDLSPAARAEGHPPLSTQLSLLKNDSSAATSPGPPQPSLVGAP